MNIPINHPVLAGGLEVLIGTSKPDRGIEFSVGLPDTDALDMTAWVTPEQAELFALMWLLAARMIRVEQDRMRSRARTTLAAQLE